MTLFNYKKIASFILIFALAMVTGLSIGKIYVDNLEVVGEVAATEEELREKDADILSWINQIESGKSATAFTAIQLYNIAEYKLYHAEQYFKLMTGVVNAPMGIKQQMRSEKVYKDGKLVLNKLSPSTSNLAPAICTQTVYDSTTNFIKINSNGTFDNNSSVVKGVFDTTKYKDYTLEEYEKIFGTHPTHVMPYIISNITCGQKKYSPITNNGDGTYSFEISIDGNYLAFAGLYYSDEIEYSSGMGAPKWVSLKMSVTIDSNFNFKTIVYEEVYQVNAPVIGMTAVSDKFTDTFEFENVPELSEFTEVL